MSLSRILRRFWYCSFALLTLHSPLLSSKDSYHWTRDAALVMQVVAAAAPSHPELVPLVAPWLTFEHKLQSLQSSAGLGEPKYNLDGTVYDGPWARPQNDGPALRVLAVSRLLRTFKQNNLTLDIDPSVVYNSEMPPSSLLKRDLEYLSRTWRLEGFEIWEECSGWHYYARRAQALALLEGASIALDNGDAAAAAYYTENARGVSRVVREGSDWAPYPGPGRHIRSTVGITNGCLPWKTSHSDAQVYLGHLHSDPLFPAFLPAESWDAIVFHRRQTPRVLESLALLAETFSSLYVINSDRGTAEAPLAPAMGRYPEDRYTGTSVEPGGGNPWVLATAGAAEVLYRLAVDWSENGDYEASFEVNGGVEGVLSRIAKVALGTDGTGQDPIVLACKCGDAFLRRVQYHVSGTGSSNAAGLSEQINKSTGAPTGARELSWSHASVVTAGWARDRAWKAAEGRHGRLQTTLEIVKGG